MNANEPVVNDLFTKWILDSETKINESELINKLLNYIDLQKPEICGKCTPCRDGVIRMETLLKMYLDKKADLSTLKELVQLTANLRASRCSVGLDIGKNFEVVLENNYNTLYNPVRKY
ncbi:MAG: NADH-ubiquinone oxidoreductase-F iron-sulfur binding region domain-containing protein [Candidatus Izemoplasma sp.]